MPYDSKAKMAALDEAENAAEGALGGHLRARVKKSKEAKIEAPAPAEGEGAAAEVAELKPLLERLIGLLGGENGGGMMPDGGGMPGGMMGGGPMMGG